MGGLEVYFQNILESLAGTATNNEYYIFLNNRELKRNFQRYSAPAVKLVYFPQYYTYVAASMLILMTRPKTFMRLAMNELNRTLSPESVYDIDTTGVYGRIIDLDRHGMDVMHFPFATIDPSFFRIRSSIVLTIPDIQHEYYPEFFRGEILELRRRLYRGSAERADIVIAISEFTKKSLIEKYGLKPEKCIVAYPSCSSEFRRIEDMNRLDAIRKKYSLPDKFLFYPAGTWPHKNHLKLLEALILLKEKYSFEQKVIMTGIAKNYHKTIMDSVGRLNLDNQVAFLNHVPFPDLPPIYNLAKIMVFPSLFEGFGIPVLEAMSVGLPVVCSDRTSLPEVAGDAALYFNPENPGEMADRIFLLWNDRNLRKDLVMKGLERVNKFTAENTLAKTLTAYSLAGGKSES
jgi:glycosyltransferase involved in cell wall biosynthesis